MNLLRAIAIAIGAFIAAPMFIVIPMSLSDSPSFAFPPTGYWLGYYRAYFSNELWTTPTINSAIIATATMFVTMALVVPASFALVRFRFPGRGMVNFLLMMPLMVPHIVLADQRHGAGEIVIHELRHGDQEMIGEVTVCHDDPQVRWTGQSTGDICKRVVTESPGPDNVQDIIVPAQAFRNFLERRGHPDNA